MYSYSYNVILFFLPVLPTRAVIDAFADHILSSSCKAFADLKETLISHKAWAWGSPVKLNCILLTRSHSSCKHIIFANFHSLGPYSHWYKTLWCKPGGKFSRELGIRHCRKIELDVLLNTRKCSGGAGSTKISKKLFWYHLNMLLIITMLEMIKNRSHSSYTKCVIHG